MDKGDVGKKFTSDGENEWVVTHFCDVVGSGEHTYIIKNTETGEELNQLVFYRKPENPQVAGSK